MLAGRKPLAVLADWHSSAGAGDLDARRARPKGSWWRWNHPARTPWVARGYQVAWIGNSASALARRCCSRSSMGRCKPRWRPNSPAAESTSPPPAPRSVMTELLRERASIPPRVVVRQSPGGQGLPESHFVLEAETYVVLSKSSDSILVHEVTARVRQRLSKLES